MRNMEFVWVGIRLFGLSESLDLVVSHVVEGLVHRQLNPLDRSGES
jgi:hypothetical protein